MKNKFEELTVLYGDDWADAILSNICEAHWSFDSLKDFGQASHGVYFSDIYAKDVINHVLSGEVTYNGEKFNFVIENGNQNGTVVLEFEREEDGEVGAYEHPKPNLWTFVPENRDLKHEKPYMWKVYLAWREMEWFKEQERKYNYDIFFQPGGHVKDHYSKWAAEKGLAISDMEHFEMLRDEPVREPLSEDLEKLITEVFTK